MISLIIEIFCRICRLNRLLGRVEKQANNYPERIYFRSNFVWFRNRFWSNFERCF